MASAEKTTITREVIVLSLTVEEAQILKRVAQRITGASKGRDAMNAIETALQPIVGRVGDEVVIARGEISLHDYDPEN